MVVIIMGTALANRELVVVVLAGAGAGSKVAPLSEWLSVVGDVYSERVSWAKMSNENWVNIVSRG